MGKITNLEQLAQTARAAKTFTSGLVGELAEAADKDIAAAKSAADAAKSAAQTAQSTADAAKTAAQTAQSTADAAKTAAQTAQNTANAAKAAAVVMKGASASAAGAAGLAPAPAAGAQGKYLRGDGTWQTPPDTNTTYTPAAAVPKAPGTAAVGTSAKYAREDHVHPAQTAVSGNAGTATKLATARAINGTNFDGSAAVTTAKWGTARSLTIGSTAKSVDGSANAAWTLSEIGAAAAGHTHTQFDNNIKVQNLAFGDYNSQTETTIQSLKSAVYLRAQNPKLHSVYLFGFQTLCRKDGPSDTEAKYAPVLASAFNVQSARRFKENFSEITREEAQKLLGLKAQHFDYIHGEKNQSGFVAEDVEPLYPEICAYGPDVGQEDDPAAPMLLQGLDYSRFVPYIVRLLQVQQQEIDALKQALAAREGEGNTWPMDQ